MQIAVNHFVRNNWQHDFNQTFQHAVSYKILADIDWDTPSRDIFTLYRSYIFPLCVCQKWKVHFRYDCEASVYIDNAYQCLDASSLIDMTTDTPCFAKTERTFPHALRLLHYPHLLMHKICRIKHRNFQKALLCHIYMEPLAIEWYFPDLRSLMAAYCHTDVYFPQSERLYDCISIHFVDCQIDIGISVGIFFDKPRHEIRCDAGADTYWKRTGDFSLMLCILVVEESW